MGEKRREEDSRSAASRPESKTTSASPLAILKSFQGGGPRHLEIRDDVDIGSRRDRVARGVHQEQYTRHISPDCS